LRSQPDLIQHIYSNLTEENIAQYIFNPIYSANHLYKADGIKETIDILLKGLDKHIWYKSLSNDWRRST